MSDGFEILRDRDWVRATRISPSPSAPGDRNTAYATPFQVTAMCGQSSFRHHFDSMHNLCHFQVEYWVI